MMARSTLSPGSAVQTAARSRKAAAAARPPAVPSLVGRARQFVADRVVRCHQAVREVPHAPIRFSHRIGRRGQGTMGTTAFIRGRQAVDHPPQARMPKGDPGAEGHQVRRFQLLGGARPRCRVEPRHATSGPGLPTVRRPRGSATIGCPARVLREVLPHRGSRWRRRSHPPVPRVTRLVPSRQAPAGFPLASAIIRSSTASSRPAGSAESSS